MGGEQMKVWLYDVSDLTWWETRGNLESTIYANCYIKSEGLLSLRHPDYTTLVIL